MNDLGRRARAAFVRWRRTLSPRERAGLAGYREESFVLVGVPVDPEALDDVAMWTDELREYVQAREDLVFHVEERRYHICRAHPLARGVIETGVIAAGFACPRGGCPFAAASRCAGGRAVQLVAIPDDGGNRGMRGRDSEPRLVGVHAGHPCRVQGQGSREAEHIGSQR